MPPRPNQAAIQCSVDREFSSFSELGIKTCIWLFDWSYTLNQVYFSSSLKWMTVEAQKCPSGFREVELSVIRTIGPQ